MNCRSDPICGGMKPRARSAHSVTPLAGEPCFNSIASKPAPTEKPIKANACFALLDHPTSDPRAATAKRLRMVGVIVAALMHHQRQPLDIAQALQAWRQDRLAGLALGVNHQGRKVAQVAVAPRFAVLATVLRVPVTACGSRRSGLAVDVGRLATALCVQVETVGSSLQARQFRM